MAVMLPDEGVGTAAPNAANASAERAASLEKNISQRGGLKECGLKESGCLLNLGEKLSEGAAGNG
jgi:hypothetical protein